MDLGLANRGGLLGGSSPASIENSVIETLVSFKDWDLGGLDRNTGRWRSPLSGFEFPSFESAETWDLDGIPLPECLCDESVHAKNGFDYFCSLRLGNAEGFRQELDQITFVLPPRPSGETVADAKNLRRALLLTLQLAELERRRLQNTLWEQGVAGSIPAARPLFFLE